jgi:ABC-type branched-subunit amino acid transport system substrate-binding protein
MADLVAYIRHLEADTDPGLSEGLIQVGTLLPLRGPQGELGQAMAQVMHAYFEEVNAEGGVYGRRVELVAVPYGDTPGATLEGLRAAFALEGMFALVGPYTLGLDDAILEIAREEGAPLVGPFTLDPGNALRDAAAFYLYSGFEDQARTLAVQAAEQAAGSKTPVVIAGPEGERIDELVAAVRGELKGKVSADPLVLRYGPGALDPPALAGQVQEGGAEDLLFFGDRAELQALLEALAERAHHPRVYLLSSRISGSLFDAPPVFHQRIFLAYPTLAQDISEKGREEYRRLAKAYALPPDHIQGQAAALAAAKLLVEGLRRAGRDLDRLALIDGIEELYQFKSGFTPPLTYGPNRRIGARGAYVVAVDLMKKRYEPVGGWHPLP